MQIFVRAVVALGVGLLLMVIAVCAAPAGVAAWWVNHETGNALVLADAEGSLRSGRARLTDSAGRWSIPIAWTLDPGSLWQGAVSIRFGVTPTDAIRGALQLSRTAVELSDVNARVPATIASAWLPSMVALAAGGEIVIGTQAIRFGERPQGRLTVRWSPARIADADAHVIDFGTFTAEVIARDDQVIATLANAGGDTVVSGEIRVAGARVDADVTLTPRTQVPSPLLRTIAVFGTAAPDGGVQFSYHGAWTRAIR